MAVQISGNDITVPRDGSFTRNVTIGGTLTYEDVTNIDSVGLVTARTGIEIGARPGVAASISVDGNMIMSGISTFGGKVLPSSDSSIDIGTTSVRFQNAYVDNYYGSGANLTALNATQLTSGTVPDARFPATLPDSSVGSINDGLGSDIQIFHDGSDSHIHNSTSNLRVRSNDIQLRDNAENFYVDCNNGGSVDLYHNGTKKLETASGGVTVTGSVAATSYTGDGSSLTGIAAGITTEAASISGITTYLNLSKDDHELVVTGTNTISVIGGAQGGSHTLRLQNSGIATVTLDSTYFKFASGATPSLPTADGAISLVSFTIHKAGAVGVNTVLLTGASVSFS